MVRTVLQYINDFGVTSICAHSSAGAFEILRNLFSFTAALGGDKVSMLTHTYPHKPLGNIEVTICNHQADSPLYVWPDV